KYNRKKGWGWIAKRLNLTKESVSGHAYRLGLTIKGKLKKGRKCKKIKKV
ncbi:unnamed protein product, partial [marine sediment metagenome]